MVMAACAIMVLTTTAGAVYGLYLLTELGQPAAGLWAIGAAVYAFALAGLLKGVHRIAEAVECSEATP